MASETDKFTHLPVWGLPRSSLVGNGDSIPVISLMQSQAGLNREIRRDFSKSLAKSVKQADALGVKIEKNEWNLLTHFLSAREKFYSFWYYIKCLKENRKNSGKKAYAMAVSLQFLIAYASDWYVLSYDEADLIEKCPEWKQIKKGLEKELEKSLAFKKDEIHFGLFMIWPRLLDDLTLNWDNSSDDQRRVISNAIFALSSISYSQWFIKTALTNCPELESELGHLLKIGIRGLSSSTQKDDITVLDLEPITEVNETNEEVIDLWNSISHRLSEIVSKWPSKPSKESLQNLSDLGNESTKLAELLPEEQVDPALLLDQAIEALQERLIGITSSNENSWLADDDIKNILARWYLAQKNASDETSLINLLQDAKQALARIESSLLDLNNAQTLANESALVSAKLDEELRNAKTASQRITISKQQSELKENELASRSKVTDLMLFVMSSASPWGEAFDPAVNYNIDNNLPTNFSYKNNSVAEKNPNENFQQNVPLNTESQTAYSASDVEKIQIIHTELNNDKLQNNAPEDSFKSHHSKSAKESTPYLKDNLQDEKLEFPKNHSPIEDTKNTKSVKPIQDIKEQEKNLFNENAGDKCKPIWGLLGLKHPALAFQFAQALAKTEQDLVIPFPSLLKCIALTKGLTRSDGQLAVDISEAFCDLDSSWFDPKNTPSNWHTAINLLLIGSTIRPMIFAPASNASKVAAFRHLDGRHSALLKLVQEVSEASESLTSFEIGPTILQSALSGNTKNNQLLKLSKQAEDWLLVRAPSKKFSYAPANKLWLHWLRQGEMLHTLLYPIACGHTESRGIVKSLLDRINDYQQFVTHVREYDRQHIRRRGQEIQAIALEHLWAAMQEAIILAKEWDLVVGTPTNLRGRLVENIERLKLAFNKHFDQACKELNQPWNDEWNQVQAASIIVESQLSFIHDIFKSNVLLPIAEPSKAELLTKDLFLVPKISIDDGWKVRTEPKEILNLLKDWCDSPPELISIIDERLKIGDFVGAEVLINADDASVENNLQLTLDRARDLWLKDIKSKVQSTRKASEIGLAYGYLSDTERSTYESEISAVEADINENKRFDDLVNRLTSVEVRIERQKSKQIEDARRQLDKEGFGLTDDVLKQLTIPLEKSDIFTFRELLQRVRNGVDPWPEQVLKKDTFKDYYPDLLFDILDQLNILDPLAVDKSIKAGENIGRLSFFLDGDVQARSAAEECYGLWANSCARRSLQRDNLRKILTFIGLVPKKLDQDQGGVGWSLQTIPLEDKEICPVPHFGSRANGRYKVHVIHERLTPEDLLSRIGEGTQQTATIILYGARPPKRFWNDLALLSKERQRSFLLLDEPMLLYLLAQTGSRLKQWFNIALPFTFSEPYDASAGFVPSEMFYGRGSELESIKEQGGCYFIYGGRQLGKTALLRKAERSFTDPKSDHYAIWIDLLAQGIGESRPASDMWISLGEKLRELKIPELDLPAVNTAKPSSVDALLVKLRNFFDLKPNSRILVLLDEADRFFEQDGLLGNGYAETRRLKELMDVTQRRFKVVFAGLHNVLRAATRSNQPLGHLNEAVLIGPLMKEREIREAEQLITRPIEAAGYEFADRSLIMRVLAQTNYYPSLIQLYCSQLLRHVRESKLRHVNSSGPRYVIEESDIESVFSGRPLRDAIRSKFRLTLQLDDRYEVIANAIGLEAIAPGFDQSYGIDWREIRNDCSTWWPEGFKTTSEREFLVLLEEMKDLGVLSEVKPAERFSLRNPNVLLLLGSKEEIENTLEAEREPRVEFESTIFRPALNGQIDHTTRSPLTYRQLDEITHSRNSVQFIASTEAAGGNNLVVGLKGHPISASERFFNLIDKATDKRSFVQELDKHFEARKDGVSVIFVPASTPWTLDWVEACRAKVSALRSTSKTVSIVFHADAFRLWLLSDSANSNLFKEPWMSNLPWARGFVRKWLEELQLPVDTVDRLFQVTGYWGGLLESMASSYRGAIEFTNNLDQLSTNTSNFQWRQEQLKLMTGGIREAQQVLRVIDTLGDGVTEDDLVEFGDLPRDLVKRTLNWGGPLGLITLESGSAWSMNPFLKFLLKESLE